MERETGIEPATNGLEGRDSTTELLPLILSERTEALVNWVDIATSREARGLGATS